MPMAAGRNTRLDWLRCPRAQGGMRSSTIIKSNKFSKSQSQVPLVDRDEIVQALPPNGPDQSFAEGICRGRLNRRSKYSHAEVVQRQVASEDEKIESRSWMTNW